eukprot:TRINITY_DN1762_c0_g1_i1.p1 TRINITY_DN1762_c0_g1~~TRINITY_DN1762_c0_g1_i1.p1  ORF type:complete len:516 (-),score=96.38 TRINITY_DN1762_c0_g1_i1:23-1516(-)
MTLIRTNATSTSISTKLSPRSQQRMTLDHKKDQVKIDLPKSFHTTERAFFDFLTHKLGLKEKDDWYQITRQDVVNYGGEGMLKKIFQDSVVRALLMLYPDHKWFLWRFCDPIPRGMWDNTKAQREFMDHLAREENIKDMNDWYNITSTQIIGKGGGVLLYRHYQGSPSKMITSILTEHNWNLQMFRRKPKQNWDDTQLLQKLIDHLSKELQITRMEDWYQVSSIQIRKKGGGALLQRYQSSPAKMLTSLFPSHKWDLQRFTRKLTGTWDDLREQKQFLVHFAKKSKLTKMEDWYCVKKEQIIEKGGGELLKKYHGSVAQLVTSVLTEHQWTMSGFNLDSRTIQDTKQFQIQLMQRIAQELRITKMEDWYTVNVAQIREKGGGELLRSYQDSPSKMIMAVFAQHEWDLFRFVQKPKGFWDDLNIQRRVMDDLTHKLNITTMQDWYHVTAAQIREKGGGRLLQKYSNSPCKMVVSLLKQHKWDLSEFASQKKLEKGDFL